MNKRKEVTLTIILLGLFIVGLLIYILPIQEWWLIIITALISITSLFPFIYYLHRLLEKLDFFNLILVLVSFLSVGANMLACAEQIAIIIS